MKVKDLNRDIDALIELLRQEKVRSEHLEKELSQARAGCYACEPVGLENERLRAALMHEYQCGQGLGLSEDNARKKVEALNGVDVPQRWIDAIKESSKVIDAMTPDEVETMLDAEDD